MATLWVGSLWTIGYLVAPTLFSTLFDRVLAGTIAGTLFRIEAWLSLGCGLLLIALQLPMHQDDTRKTKNVRLIVMMLACTLIGYFATHPFMASMREAAGASGVMSSDVKWQFGLLHGVASLLYLIQSLLGVKLILQMR